MKRNNSIVTVLVTTALFFTGFTMFFSCKKDKPHTTYSCDASLNEWVTKNMGLYDSLSRDSLSLFPDIDTQQAIYQTFTSTHKMNIWVQKLNKVKSTYGLSESAKTYVQSAIDHLNASDFDGANLGALNTWITSWANTGKTTYSWTDADVFFMIGTWMTEGEMDAVYSIYTGTPGSSLRLMAPGGAYAGGSNPGPVAPPGGHDCACYYSISCWGSGKVCVDETGCDKVGGCGLMGTSNCSGNCN